VYQLFSPVRLGRIARVRTAQVLGHLPRRELRFAHVPEVPGQMYRLACKRSDIVIKAIEQFKIYKTTWQIVMVYVAKHVWATTRVLLLTPPYRFLTSSR